LGAGFFVVAFFATGFLVAVLAAVFFVAMIILLYIDFHFLGKRFVFLECQTSGEGLRPSP
jgi:hypothetical protein